MSRKPKILGILVSTNRREMTVKLTVPPNRQELKLTWTVIYHWKRKPHFSSEHLSKTGYWLGVCHGWFHLHWIIRHVMSANRESQNENSWSVWDSNPGPSVRSEVAKCCTPRSDNYRVLQFWLRFIWVCYLIYLYHVVDEAKLFVVYLCHVLSISFCCLTN